jgi:hypothetical protein
MAGPPMIAEVETLSAFFGLEDQGRAAKTAIALAKNSKLAAARALPAPLREAAAMSLIDAGRALLASPLAAILGEAWQKARDLRRFRDRSAYPPDQVHEYTLAEHEITLKRNPVVEVMVDGAPTGLKIPFELNLSLAVLSAVLRIQNAHIIGARVGDLRGGGKFSCASMTLAQRKTSAFKLPGAVSFGQGIPLGKPYGRAPS